MTSKKDAGNGPQTRPLSSVLKTLSLLDLIAESPDPVQVSELAAKADGRRAAVHQQLVTLATAGWVEQLPDRSYRLSLHASRLAQAALQQAGIGDRLLPAMEALVAELQEAISLAILDGGAARIIQRAEPGRAVRVDLRVESRMPIATSGSGKVLVANLAPPMRTRMREEGVEIPSERELEKVREQGWAESSLDWPDGARAIAVPLRDANGACIAALSVASPGDRYDREKFLAALVAKVEELNSYLQGRGDSHSSD